MRMWVFITESNNNNEETERIGVIVSTKTKDEWKRFIKKHEISTISKLIRTSVEFYMESESKNSLLKNITSLTHDLKEPLTSIKGFSQLTIENDLDKLENLPNIRKRIKEIYNQSVFLENKINEILNGVKKEPTQYDILIIEDDSSTITVLTEFLKIKGYTSIGVTTGTKALEELNRSTPRLILLDILLPDISGYEVYEKIKSNKNLNHIPIFYITAIPESEVREEPKAEGLLLKPFNFREFEDVFDYLKK